MENIAVMVALSIAFVMVGHKIATEIARPLTMKNKQMYGMAERYRIREEPTLMERIEKISKRMPLFEMSEEEEELTWIKLRRLVIDKKPQEIRQMQMLYAVTSLAGAIIFLVIGIPFLAALAFVGVFILWKLPIMLIDSKIQKRNEAVKKELPELYVSIYYSYKYKTNIKLLYKIQAYMMNIESGPFYDEMQLFIDDLRIDEQIALRNLKKRVPVDIVFRFCDVMEQRILGYDNVEAMTSLKTHIEAARREKEDMLIKEMEEKMEGFNSVMIKAGLFVLAGVYFYAQIAQAFNK